MKIALLMVCLALLAAACGSAPAVQGQDEWRVESKDKQGGGDYVIRMIRGDGCAVTCFQANSHGLFSSGVSQSCFVETPDICVEPEVPEG